MLRQIVIPIVLFVAVALGAAQAENVRLPKTGAPAFAFDAPAGWTVLYDEFSNLRLTADDHSCALQLSMIDDPGVEKVSLSDLAAQIMKAAGAPPYSKTESGTIAGKKGTAYISQIKNDKGVDIVLRVTLLKLDSHHVASQGEMRTVGMTGAQTHALDALIGMVRLTGLK